MAKADVELRVRAQDDASKNIAGIATSLEKLTEAQQKLAGTTSKASDGISKIVTEIAKLGSAGAAGKAFEGIANSVAKVTASIEKQERGLADTAQTVEQYKTSLAQAKAALEAATKAQNEFIGPQTKAVVKEQAKALRELQTEVNKAQGGLEKASTSYQKQSDSIEESRQALTRLNQEQQNAAALMQKVAAIEERAAKLQERRAQITQQSANAAKGFAAFAEREAQVIEAASNARARRRVALEQEAKAAEEAAAANARLKAEMQRVAAAEQVVRNAGAGSTQQQLATATAELKAAYAQLNGELSKVSARYGAFSKEADDLRQRQLRLADAITAGEQAMRGAADTARKDAAAKAEQATANSRLAASAQQLAAAEALVNNPSNKTSKEQLAVAVMALRARYSQLSLELNRAQTETGLFSDKAQKLRGEVYRLAQSIKAGEQAVADFGEQGQRSFSLFNDGGRTTLSFTQRLRGQILSLAAAYVGLFGAVDLVRGALKQQEQMTGTQARLDVLFNGDGKQTAAELKLVRDAADDLGMVYNDLAAQYSKVAVAATASGATIEQARTVFFNLAEASKAVGTTNEQNERIFNAITQIFSKGKISAEELRQQLGDALPGATAILAKALGKTTAEMEKMMQQGEITSGALVDFSIAAKEAFGQGRDAQVSSLTSELNRAKNVLNDMRTAFLEGFGPAFAEALRGFREAFGGNAGAAEIARKAGAAIGELAKWMVTLVKVIKDALPLIVAFGAAWATAKLGDTISRIVMMRDGMGSLVDTLKQSGAEVGKVGSALMTFDGQTIKNTLSIKTLQGAMNSLAGLMTAFGSGYAIGGLLLKFGQVQKVAVRVVGAIQLLRVAMEGLGKSIGLVAQLTTFQINLSEFGERLKGIWRDTAVEGVRAMQIVAQQLDDIDKGVTDLSDPMKGVAEAAENQYQAELKRQEEIAKAQAAAADAAAKAAKASEEAASAADKAAKAEAKRKAGLEELARTYESVSNKSRDLMDREANFARKTLEQTRDGEELGLQARLAQMDLKVGEFEQESRAIEADLRAQAARIEQLLNDPRLTEAQRAGLVGQRRDVTAAAGTLANFRDGDTEAYRERLDAIARLEDAQQEAARLEQQRQIALENNARRAKDLKLNEVQLNQLNNRTIEETSVALEDAYLKAAAYADIVGQPAAAESLRAQAAAVRDDIVPAFDMWKTIADGVYSSLINGMTQFAYEAVKGFGEALAGMQSWSDALKGVGNAFRSFAAQVLQQIAQLIIQYAILRALAGGIFGAGIGSFAQGQLGGAGVPASVNHRGGTIGATNGTMRTVSAAWFANAQRFHSGGLPGLKRDEVPAILQTGEEVLSRNDPRNVLNGGGGGSRPQDIKIINTIESGSVVSQGVATREGEKAILNFVRANKAAVKQALA